MLSKTARYLWPVLLAYLLPLLLVVVVLLAAPGIRHNVFRVAAETPGVGIYFILRRSVISRDFAGAAGWLQKQLDLSVALTSKQSTLLPGVINNAAYVVDRARFQEEWSGLLPFLKNLAATNPDLHIARIWLARAYLAIRPADVFAEAEAAARLIPADSRAYRLAVLAAQQLDDQAGVAQWCARYGKAQLGGTHPHEFNPLFAGLGLRKLAIEIGDDKVPTLVGNEGIHLGQARTYSFSLPSPIQSPSLRLHLGTLPSVEYRIHAITVFSADGRERLARDRVSVSPLKGFFGAGGWLSSAAADGETLTIGRADGTPFIADRIDLEMTFRRRGLLDVQACVVEAS